MPFIDYVVIALIVIAVAGTIIASIMRRKKKGKIGACGQDCCICHENCISKKDME